MRRIVFEAAAATAAVVAAAAAAAAAEKEAVGEAAAGRQMSEEGERRKGRGGLGAMQGDGDERAARAPGRVCVRLINQTLAFGVPARGKEEESGIAGEEEEEARRNRRGEERREVRGEGGCRPGRVEYEAEPGQAKPGRPRRFGPLKLKRSSRRFFFPLFFFLSLSPSLPLSLSLDILQLALSPSLSTCYAQSFSLSPPFLATPFPEPLCITTPGSFPGLASSYAANQRHASWPIRDPLRARNHQTVPRTP